MEKALEILNNLTNEDIWTLQQIRLEHEQLYKAIAELEEAMKPKTCDGCRYGAFGVNGLGFEVECRIGYNCSRGREDRYEAKEQL